MSSLSLANPTKETSEELREFSAKKGTTLIIGTENILCVYDYIASNNNFVL